MLNYRESVVKTFKPAVLLCLLLLFPALLIAESNINIISEEDLKYSYGVVMAGMITIEDIVEEITGEKCYVT